MSKSLLDRTTLVLGSVGEFGLFSLRAIRESFQRPIELSEATRQLVEIGWRSVPLVIISGFAFGIVLALQTGSSMVRFGAEAEGYADAGSPAERYLQSRFELKPDLVGAIALSDKPPPGAGRESWNGVCLSLVVSRN